MKPEFTVKVLPKCGSKAVSSKRPTGLLPECLSQLLRFLIYRMKISWRKVRRNKGGCINQTIEALLTVRWTMVVEMALGGFTVACLLYIAYMLPQWAFFFRGAQ